MRMFAFDPEEYRDVYKQQGWVHIRGGLEPEFLETLRTAVGLHDEHRVEGRAIGGRKTQSLFDFPPDVAFPDELFDVVASLCELERPSMTLSERHIKAYDPDAEPEPTAHKDRLASQVSMGLSIDVPPESRLVIYPDDDRWENPFNVSAALLPSLPPHRHPDVLLRDAREVELADTAGDVVVFPGSSMWHLRRRPANVVNLYLKFNAFGSDPLGEDPATDRRREETLAALADGADGLETLRPVRARRLDTIGKVETRSGSEAYEARVWEREPLRLEQLDIDLIRATDDGKDAAALAGAVGVDVESAVARLRHLAQKGVLDLIRLS